MIQGAGSKEWVSTVFAQVSDESASNLETSQETCQSQSDSTTGNNRRTTVVPETPCGRRYGPFPPKVSKSKSPLKYLSKLVFGGSGVASSPSNYGQTDLQTSPVFNKKNKKCNSGLANYKPVTESHNETDNSADKEFSCKEHEPNISEKSISRDNTNEVSANVECEPQQINSRDTNVKTSTDQDNVGETLTSNTISPEKLESIASQTISEDLENCKSAISLLQRDNRDLQENLRQLMDVSKKANSENKKLLALIDSKNEEIDSLKLKLGDANKTSKKQETDVKTLRNKLAEETKCSLVLQEENKKLKLEIKSINKEKEALLDQIIRQTGTTDTIEAKIENEMTELKDEMTGFKDSIFAAINGLKSQIEKSMTVTRPDTQTRQIQQMPQRTEIQDTTATSTTVTDTQQQSAATCSRKCTALIIGDSTTRILSSNKLSNDDLQVKIKSHAGGRLHDLYNSVIHMAETDDFICTADAVIIHGGTNNLSDGDSVDSVEKEVSQIVQKIKHINPDCKVIVSSVMPRKNDRLANQLINQTNRTLKGLCESNSYDFMDITGKVLKDNEPVTDLYRDNIHLNTKGGKIFGEMINSTIRQTLKLPPQPVQPSTDEQDFRIGRLPGRRPLNRNNNGSNRTTDHRDHNRQNNSSHTQNNNVNSWNKNNNSPNNNNTWNNNPQNNNSNWMGHHLPMMFMPMPFPSWTQQTGNQVSWTNQ